MTETDNTAPTRRTPARLAVYIAGGVIVLALLAAFAVAGYTVMVAPALAKATAAKCHATYSAPAARADCRSGHAVTAAAAEKAYKASQKRAAVEAACAAKYSSDLAVADCKDGDVTTADAEQKTADDAAAAAAKKAAQGRSFDNPYPAGTHVPMQSTNRLDGATVTYVEWVSGFDGDWQGYNQFQAPGSGMKYVAFVVNVQASDAGVNAGTAAYDASFTDQNGSVYSRDSVTYQATPQMPQVTLGAGQQASGVVVFQVPASVTGGVATFGDGTVFAALQ